MVPIALSGLRVYKRACEPQGSKGETEVQDRPADTGEREVTGESDMEMYSTM